MRTRVKYSNDTNKIRGISIYAVYHVHSYTASRFIAVTASIQLVMHSSAITPLTPPTPFLTANERTSLSSNLKITISAVVFLPKPRFPLLAPHPHPQLLHLSSNLSGSAQAHSYRNCYLYRSRVNCNVTLRHSNLRI